jgi:UDP:flavonoid glycosyltransferase YjiC (YdhE family)
LKQQGHEISFLTGSALRARVEAKNIAFDALHGYADYDWQDMQQSLFTPEEASAKGLEGLILQLSLRLQIYLVQTG